MVEGWRQAQGSKGSFLKMRSFVIQGKESEHFMKIVIKGFYLLTWVSSYPCSKCIFFFRLFSTYSPVTALVVFHLDNGNIFLNLL